MAIHLRILRSFRDNLWLNRTVDKKKDKHHQSSFSLRQIENFKLHLFCEVFQITHSASSIYFNNVTFLPVGTYLRFKAFPCQMKIVVNIRYTV